MVKLLSEDACAVEGISATVRSTWRGDVDIGGIIGDGEIKGKVVASFSVLLLWEAVQVY